MNNTIKNIFYFDATFYHNPRYLVVILSLNLLGVKLFLDLR